MAISIRRFLQPLVVIVAVLALPVTLIAQSPTAESTGPGAELPDAPLVASLTPDSASVLGRDAYFRANAAALPPEPVIAIDPLPAEAKSHRFWDRENAILFTAVGGMAAADFYLTHANLAGGGKELNPITRVFAGNTPALATNFALETSGTVALSYLFHKTGHHRLERATSLLSIVSSTGAVSYDWMHR